MMPIPRYLAGELAELLTEMRNMLRAVILLTAFAVALILAGTGVVLLARVSIVKVIHDTLQR